MQNTYQKAGYDDRNQYDDSSHCGGLAFSHLFALFEYLVVGQSAEVHLARGVEYLSAFQISYYSFADESGTK